MTVRHDTDTKPLTSIIIESQSMRQMFLRKGRIQRGNDDCNSEWVMEWWAGAQTKHGIVRCGEESEEGV